MLAASFLCAVLYKLAAGEKKALKGVLTFYFPVILLVAVFNFIFTHYGVTVLFVFKEMNFTLEALLYGLTQGLLLSSVLLWFSLCSSVVTSERFLAVFGGFAPNLALVFSMTLAFIPRFKKNSAQISEARMLLDTGEGKMKKSINNFSALITMTLEESIDTADSMKARGFGKKRSVYSKYRFSLRDAAVILFIAADLVLIIVFKAMGEYDFSFDPTVTFKTPLFVSFASYLLLALLPVVTDFSEDIRWHFLKRKI